MLVTKQFGGLAVKKFHEVVTLSTAGATTNVGLTPGGVVLHAAVRVATEIAGLDSNNHAVNLGVSGTADKYCDVPHGSSATTIAKNKKGHYAFDPEVGVEASALILTIDGGSDNTPSAGAVEVEVVYQVSLDLADD